MPLKKRTLFGVAGLAMALLVCSPKASAQDSPPATQAAPQGQAQPKDEITAVPNRPTFASTGEVVQRGVFEIEYGFEAADGHQNINGLLKFGLFKNLELWFLNNPVERDAGLAGMGDSGAGFKWRIVPQKKERPTVSVLYVATLPTAKDVLGAGEVGHLVQLLVSKDFGKHHFDVNFGPHFVGRTGAGGFDRHYFSSLSWSHPLRGKWSATVEIAGFSRTNAATPATLTILAAPTYSVSPRLVLDAGAYVAAHGNLPRITFFAGVTYSIADLYRRSSERKSARR
jgi:Putative MetA-pathway of phenol degradation